MDIRIVTDKTLIIPEDAPLLLKPERLEADCRWQYIRQEGEKLMAEGMAEFRLAYLTLSPEAYEDCEYEELLQLLEEAACNPQIPQLRHCLTLQCPLEIAEKIEADCEIVGLQLYDLSYAIISPRALELQMEFCAEIREKQPAQLMEEEKCDEAAEMPEPCGSEEEVEKDCSCEKPEQEPEPCEEEEAPPEEEKPCTEDKTEEENNAGAPRCNPRFSAARQPSFRSEGAQRIKSSYSMKFYRVREGDSLWTIAEKMQVPAAEISRINKLEDGEITAGMLLSIP